MGNFGKIDKIKPFKNDQNRTKPYKFLHKLTNIYKNLQIFTKDFKILQKFTKVFTIWQLVKLIATDCTENYFDADCADYAEKIRHCF